jgi:hypothetical protein
MSAFRVLPNWLNIGRYEGQVNEKNRPHGKGVIRYEPSPYNSRFFYEGDFEDGTRHGRGCMLYQNGDIFEGEWRASHQHFGTYRWRDYPEDRYVGHFQNCFFEDEDGVMIYGTRGYDSGSFKLGTLDGWGTMVRKDGYTRCEFVKGKRQGRVATFWWNGCVLESTFVDDKRIGPASFLWTNGDRWTGEFHSDTCGTGIKTEEATGKQTSGTFEWVTTPDWHWAVTFVPDKTDHPDSCS